MSACNTIPVTGSFDIQNQPTQSHFIRQPASITDYPRVFQREAIVSRSQLNLAILSKLPDVIRAISPFATQQNRRIHAHDLTFYLHPEIDCFFPGCFINPGYWRKNNLGVWGTPPYVGTSLVTLYAWMMDIPECAAEAALRAHLQLPDAMSSAADWKPQGWIWEKRPLFVPPIHPLIEPTGQRGMPYLGTTGLPILKATQTWDSLGTSIRYFSLWRRSDDPIAHWVEALPPGDLPIFTLVPMISSDQRPLRMLASEFDPRFSNLNARENYFAVPGGASSLVRANLAALAGRQVHLELLLDELAYTPGIIDALGSSKAGDVTVSFVGGWEAFPLERLREVADSRGHSFPIPALPALTLSDTALIPAGSPTPSCDSPRKMLLTPVIQQGGLVWLYAPEKMGKTWLALSIAQAVSQGGSLGPWHAPEPASVLYIDGEMHPDDLKTAIAKVTRGQGDRGTVSFGSLCAKNTETRVINLLDPVWQSEIERCAKGVSLLILDNFYSLTNNNVGEFPEVLDFLQRLRAQSTAVLVVDHTNREGVLQGAHAKERAAETIIELRMPEGRQWREKVRAIEVTKSRHDISEIAEYFTGTMVFTPGTFRFEVEMPEMPSAPEPLPKEIAKLAPIMIARDIDNLSFPQIQERLGTPRSTASDWYRKAKSLTGPDQEVLDQEIQRLLDARKATE